MEHEELYIVVDNERRRLDLKSPSGLTLKLVNNLFSDLSKITSSYSYTFTLPMTQNNRRVLSILEDVRMSNTLTKNAMSAEYIINGVPLVRNANLYVEEVSNGYKCVMTWGVALGLSALKDNDLALNELPLSLGTATWDKGKAGIFIVGNTIKTYGLYGAVKWELYDIDIPYSCQDNVWYLLYSAGYPFSRNTYYLSDSSTGVENTMQYQPKPCVPVRKLLSVINNYYGTDIRIGRDATRSEIISIQKDNYNNTRKDDFVTYGCIPLTGIGGSSEGAARYAVRLVAIDYVNLYNAYLSCRISYIPVMSPVASNAFITLLWYWNNNMVTRPFFSRETKPHDDCYCIGFSIKNSVYVRGKAVLRVNKEHFTYEEMRALKIYVVETKDSDIKTDDAISINPTSNPVLINNDEYEIVFDFGSEDSFEYNKVSISYTDEEQEWQAFTFWAGGKMFDDKLLKFYSLDYTVVPQVQEETTQALEIDVVANLPDVGCLDFVKSLFMMSGAFPQINNDGSITPIYYSDIHDNIISGNCYDWSGKLLNSDSQVPEGIKFRNDSFAQHNYYLMKNDDRGKSKQEQLTEQDVYADGMFDLRINDNLLDMEDEVYTSPFNAPYVLNRNDFRLSTGNTIKAWTEEGKITESQPAYMYIDTNWSKRTGQIDQPMRAKVWNPFIEQTASFEYMQKILNNATYITEKMRLNEMDLYDIDFAKPVYLNRYNSYFGIVSIQRSKDGYCKVELIKLPNIE